MIRLLFLSEKVFLIYKIVCNIFHDENIGICLKKMHSGLEWVNNMNTLMFDINNAVTEGGKRTCNKGMGSWQEKRINYIYTQSGSPGYCRSVSLVPGVRESIKNMKKKNIYICVFQVNYLMLEP